MRRWSRPLVAVAALSVVAAVTGVSTASAPAGNSYTTTPAPGATGQTEGEPSIAVNWKTGATFLQVGLDTLKVTFDSSGQPTWNNVGPLATGIVSLDPIAASDNATGRVFVSQLVGLGSLMAYTDDDGATWTTSQGSGIPAGADHQTVGAGPYPAEGAPSHGAYPNAVYYCSQEFAAALCARSDSGGLSFGLGSTAYTSECRALHGHVRVGPDGTVYLPNRWCGSGQGVAVSRDAGVTWTVRAIPGTANGVSDPSVATGKDTTAYVGLSDGSGKALASVSRDHGTTWSTPYNVGASQHVVNSAFAEMIAGDGDRAAMAFLGTTTPGDAQDPNFGQDPSHTRYTGAEWHLYVATTYDRGRTWKTVDATPKDPVQRGRICLAGASCTTSDRNLLDFMDIQVDRAGRVLVGWPDGCTGACVTSTLVATNSYASKGTITRQKSGRGLFTTPPKLAG